MPVNRPENYFGSKERIYGQYYTEPAIADFIVKFALQFLDRCERGIDPACGDGVFLESMLNAGVKEVWGVDIDPAVLNYVKPLVRERARIIIADSLVRSSLSGKRIPENYFDLVVGNPPFNASYGKVRDSRLKYYELGRGRQSQATEILFLERFIQLARDGGIVGIILPDSVFTGEETRYVREYILRYKVLGVISIPRGMFRGGRKTAVRTAILFLKKEPNDGGEMYAGEIKDLSELGSIDAVIKNAKRVKPVAVNLNPQYYGVGVEELKFKPGLEIKTLGELVEEVRRGVRTRIKNNEAISRTSGIKCISARTVTPCGLDYSRNDLYVVPGSMYDKPRYYAKPGEILLVYERDGSYGKACVVIDEADAGVACGSVYIIRLRDKELMPYYVAVYLQSRPGKAQIEKIRGGSVIPRIPIQMLLEIKVPVLPDNILGDIKSKYLTMFNHLRGRQRDGAKRLFNDMVRQIECMVLDKPC